jgi:NADH dehydrogenase
VKKRVVIIGGGFAGLQLAKNIDTQVFDVLLFDSSNHHQFQPLFYQVAAAQLEPSSISFPFRKIFQNKQGVKIRMAAVSAIHPEKQQIATDIGTFDYDYLVIAAGCKTNYFGNKSLERGTMPLKSTRDAIRVRNAIITNFEKITANPNANEALYNIVIVGAGPTGVELSGAFAEMKKHILPKDYPEIDSKKVRIILVEGSSKTLGNMSEMSQEASLQYLKNLGVEVVLNTFVKDYSNQVITLSNGDILPTANVIWAAGVQGNTIDGISEDVIRNQRYQVDNYNEVIGYKHIYAIGDIALLASEKYPKGHPQVANVAINQAKNLAKNLSWQTAGKSLIPFRYMDKGSMATVGKYKATVDLPFLSFKGFFAWLVWMFLHLMLILSVRNKLIIFINWMWGFFTNDTSLRLIFNKPEVKNKEASSWEHHPI